LSAGAPCLLLTNYDAWPSLNAAADTMAVAGIRLRHPGASPREQFLRLATVKLGRELALQVYPEIDQLDVRPRSIPLRSPAGVEGLSE